MNPQTITRRLPAPPLDAVLIDGIYTVLHHHVPAPVTLPPVPRVWVH